MPKTPEMMPGDLVTLIEVEWYTRLFERPDKSKVPVGGISGDAVCIVIALYRYVSVDITPWVCIMTSDHCLGWTNRFDKIRYVDLE